MTLLKRMFKLETDQEKSDDGFCHLCCQSDFIYEKDFDILEFDAM
jgi:hypothetical protein